MDCKDPAPILAMGDGEALITSARKRCLPVLCNMQRARGLALPLAVVTADVFFMGLKPSH